MMPIGIDGLLFAGAVECGDLIGAQIPAFGGEILAELLFVAGSDDDRRNGGALQEPVQGDLRDGFACLFRDGVEGVDNLVEIFVGDLRTLF